MFLPKAFHLDDEAASRRVICEHSFATLVTGEGGFLEASHIPLELKGEAPLTDCYLLGHLARGNPMSAILKELEQKGEQALAIFQGPHAYISPSSYQSREAVPTWNYLAVHLHCSVNSLREETRDRYLEELVARYEAGRAEPWSLSGQSETYLKRMKLGIYAFSLKIERVESKAKLSQNRAFADRQGVANDLQATPDADAQASAKWMQDLGLLEPENS